MTKILEDLSPATLVTAIEENMFAFTPFSHGWPNTERYQGKELSWCLTNVSFPTCNTIFRARLAPEKTDKTIEYLMAKARRRGIPLEWLITRDTLPVDLGKYLVAHGFIQRGDGAGMAIDLLEMKEDSRQPVNLNITEVKDDATLKTCCRIAQVGFGAPDSSLPALVEWFTKDIELKQPVRFYLGSLNGKPVSTSMVFFAEGVAGLYFVATLPEARNRGIGFAITQKPLKVAREMGYRVGTLQASKMGEPVYRHMGFKEYCRISTYMWRSKPM